MLPKGARSNQGAAVCLPLQSMIDRKPEVAKTGQTYRGGVIPCLRRGKSPFCAQPFAGNSQSPNASHGWLGEPRSSSKTEHVGERLDGCWRVDAERWPLPIESEHAVHPKVFRVSSVLLEVTRSAGQALDLARGGERGNDHPFIRGSEARAGYHSLSTHARRPWGRAGGRKSIRLSLSSLLRSRHRRIGSCHSHVRLKT